MMSRRHLRSGLVAAGWGLLGAVLAVLAGCGSVAAPAGASAHTPSTGASAPAAPAGASATIRLVGCANVNQATAVIVNRAIHVMIPMHHGSVPIVDPKPGLARALFRDFCAAVTHPDVPPAVLPCPADFGTEYAGAFYDGNRVLARFSYYASGCQRVYLYAGNGSTLSTVMAGRAAAAAPDLSADFAAILGSATPVVISPPAQLNPGGTNRPA